MEKVNLEEMKSYLSNLKLFSNTLIKLNTSMLHIENTILLAIIVVLILLLSIYHKNNSNEAFYFEETKIGDNLKTTLENLNKQLVDQMKSEVTQSDKIQDIKNKITELSKQIEKINGSNNSFTNVEKLYNTNGEITSL